MIGKVLILVFIYCTLFITFARAMYPHYFDGDKRAQIHLLAMAGWFIGWLIFMITTGEGSYLR